jgi:hypothetical protein
VTFAELYGEALDHELGSYDQSELFTVLRRKRATNRAQREFARLTSCFVIELVQPLTTGVGRYDLDALSLDTFVNFMARPLRLRKTTVASGAVTEDRLTRHDEAWLDVHRPGWANSPQRGTPDVWALAAANGVNEIALSPQPDVLAAETWDLVVPVLLNPPDMVSDDDRPFSWQGNPQMALEPYHWGIAHYAAALLERLRKDREAVESQLTLFGAYVQDYKATRRPRGGDLRVRYVRDYQRRTRNSGTAVIEQGDPRV